MGNSDFEVDSSDSPPGAAAVAAATTAAPRVGRNVVALSVVSFFTDVSSEMIYPLLPVFLSAVLHASASAIGVVEGAAESTAALLKLASGVWSDRARRRKPLVVWGYAIASVARPLVAVAQSVGQVVAIRVSDRIGKGIRTSPRDALIADSVDPSIRGRAFGLHRASDHAGAVVGPLIAFYILQWDRVPLRHVFWLAGIPGVIAVVILLVAVRDVPRARPASPNVVDFAHPLGRRFWAFLGVVFLFTLGNSTDAFLLLRAAELGVPVALAPVLWAVLNAVKSASSTPGGMLSDRIGRKPLIVAGWVLYGVVYLLFGLASRAWQMWVLFAVYGLYFGFTEGVEKALVTDLVPADRRGSAFGWYNLALGLGAFPASLIFGAIWDHAGAPRAFVFGALLALLSAVGIAIVAPRRRAPDAA